MLVHNLMLTYNCHCVSVHDLCQQDVYQDENIIFVFTQDFLN
jgi:hypothetical protein